MNSPATLLPSNTTIRTNAKLDDTKGMLINKRHLDQRRPSAEGRIVGIVAGHGGDVYWVLHPDTQTPAAYCFTEFELAETTSDRQG